MSRPPEQCGLPTQHPTRTTYYSAQAQRTPPPLESDQGEPRRTPNSSRYRPTGIATTTPTTVVRVTHHGRAVPPRARATTERHTQDDLARPQSATPITEPARRVPGRLWHWLTYIGVALLLMVTGFIIISTGISWWKNWQDDMRYGRPRTYQTDAKVGHGDSITPSHFIAVNLNGRILVTEIAGGDPAKSKIYIGPDIGDADLPVTLEFRDVNGDKRPDMLIRVNKKAYAFINDTIDNQPQFRPPKEGETADL